MRTKSPSLKRSGNMVGSLQHIGPGQGIAGQEIDCAVRWIFQLAVNQAFHRHQMILQFLGVVAQVGHRFGFEFAHSLRGCESGFCPKQTVPAGVRSPHQWRSAGRLSREWANRNGQPSGNAQTFARSVAPLRIKVINHHLCSNPVLFIRCSCGTPQISSMLVRTTVGRGRLVRPGPKPPAPGRKAGPRRAGQPPARPSPTGQE